MVIAKEIMNWNTIKTDLQKTIRMPLKKIMENQDIIKAQMSEADLGYGKCKLNNKGLLRLRYWEYLYQAARDIKEFDGTIDAWTTFVNDIICKEGK